MSIIGWNPHGMGQPGTVLELVQLVRTLKPKIVFLCETRQRDDKIKKTLDGG